MCLQPNQKLWCSLVRVQSGRSGVLVRKSRKVPVHSWSGSWCSMADMGGMIQGGLPIFDGSMFNDWKIKMNAIFIFQDVAEVVEHGVSSLGAKATDDDKKAYKIQHKLDGKARYLIYQCVSSPIFNRISMAGTAKEAWDILVATYGAGDKHKKVKLQAL